MQNEKTMIFEGLKVYDNGWPWNCDVMTSSEAVNERISFAKELIKEYKKYKNLIKFESVNESPAHFSDFLSLDLFPKNDFGQLLAIENYPEISSHDRCAGPDHPSLYNIHIWKEIGSESYNIQIPTRPCGPEDIEQNRAFGDWLRDFCDKNGKNIWFGRYQVNDKESLNTILEKVHSSIKGEKFGFLYRVLLKKSDFGTFTETMLNLENVPESVQNLFKNHDSSLNYNFYSFLNQQHIFIENRREDYVCVDFIEEQ